MFLLLSVIAVTLWFVVFRYRRRRLYKLAKMFPSPNEELPFIGVAHSLSGSTEKIMSSLQNFSYVAMRNDGMVRVWLNHILYILILDPVDLEYLLKTRMEKDDLHRFIRTLTGFGAIFAPVAIWRRRRKILVPAFSPKIVESFVEVFSEQSEKLATRLEDSSNTGKFSLWPYVSTYTLDSVCETAMGVKINAQSNPNTPFLVSMNRILHLFSKRICHIWLHPEWLFKLFPIYKEHQECVHQMHSFTDDVIQRKREEISTEQQNKTEADHHCDLGSYKTKTFLDHLIHLSGGEKGYTNVELREEVLTLAVAGTDTSAVAIGYTLALLAKYPAAQERVYQELHDVFGDSDRPLDKEDLPKLKYLERVVKESLRLFPPVPFIIRKIEEDTQLPSGRVVPAGSGALVCIWGVHRDPKYWGPDAEKFDPDRFLPERFNLKQACSFMPFSQGPRNCIGYQYAMMSMKTALSAVIRRYRVIGEAETTAVPHIRVKLEIMMKAVDGYQVALVRRKPATTATANAT